MTANLQIPTDLQSLLEHFPNIAPNDRDLIERAYFRAEQAHAGQKRKSGEPYFTHCVAVANILADMKLDAEAIAAALLHDVIEDTGITREDLSAEFGDVVAALVDGVTKLTKLPIQVAQTNSRRSSNVNRELEYIRKMLLAMGDDIRVVLIKLADRLHNMRTLGYMPPEKQLRIARETMDIFAPLANRLGIWQIKWELEDLSFRYLEPEAYKRIATSLAERRADRERYIAEIAEVLRKELAANGITNPTITGRPKHIYSIYRKMQRKNVPLEQIYDQRAVRIIVDEVWQCYLVLGIVHNLWRPIASEFDDYIAAPKDNFYRSLHTAVVDKNGKVIEVQIRTWEMHEDAEYGIAAHWRYKEGTTHDKAFEERINYLRRLMEFGSDVKDDAKSFVDAMRAEVFQDRVYVFTPKGDIIDLPAGATPIDFAYHIHTEIGHRCRGAKVDGRLVPLDYTLKTSDRVEILTAKRGGPSMDWLNPDLGYVKTSRARSKIRHWFRKQNRDKHIALGRDVLERELRRLGMSERITFESVAHLFDYEELEDFLAAIGVGDINSSQIANRLLAEEKQREEERRQEELLNPPSTSVKVGDVGTNSILIQGADGLLVTIAKCCRPMPGDPIIGYITRGRGVTVHRTSCKNIQNLSDPERLIDVSWSNVLAEETYTVPIEIVAYDREGLMRDISTIIADEKINLSDVRVSTRQNIATFHLMMEIRNASQLTRVMNRLDGIPSVVEVHRRQMV